MKNMKKIFFRCPSSFIGERCELEYSLCDIANPCIGNSTCTLRNGSPTCQCENGKTLEQGFESAFDSIKK